MQFKEIGGLSEVTKRLIQSVELNRISHAQLFFGPEGNGKLALAIAFAQYVSCTARTTTDSCGVCPSCKKYQKLIHPDLHFVFPVIRTPKFTKPVSDNYLGNWREYILKANFYKLTTWLEHIGAENQQGGIYAHESEQIIRKLNLKTYEAEYKIMIIWFPEKMNISASNKLLKMIEEPPPKTLFILVSEDINKILGTILSRTQAVKIPALKIEEVSEIIIEDNPELTPQQITDIARIANGNMVRAQNLISKSEETQRHFGQFSEWMRLCYTKNVVDIVRWVDEMSREGRERQKGFLLYALRMMRESFALNAGGENAQSISYLINEEKDFATKFSKFISPKNIFKINEELNNAHFHIERNALNKLVFLDLSLKIIKLIR